MPRKHISKEEAKNIALAKIMDDFRESIEFIDAVENRSRVYLPSNYNPTDLYFLHVESKKPAVGISRIICISKSDGKIVFDGEVG